MRSLISYSYNKLKVGLKTSVSLSSFCFCKLLIKCLVNVVFPTPISPIKNIQSIKIIEWPDLIQTPLKNKLEIHLKYRKNDNEREVEFVGLNKWANIANEL